ncbi:uncharacterized protein LOC113340539 [Papaver somniferum]|uniref:uncharacterized protein LOC113340539 n=1 Tax=Papaver somniferum TaxID=3469 RepID=UPI000E700E02|nr:uncharacterized protein LOC113340539 [Papaver somniferum]
MRSPVQGRPLILYTSSGDVAIGALLAEEDEEGVKHPIHYFNRTMKDAQLRYQKDERECLALAHAMQIFRHYLLSNRVVLVSKDDPIKFLLSKPALIVRPGKWLLQMSEFDIVCVSPKEIKGQEVADLLAAFPGEDSATLPDDVPGELPGISVVKEETWLLYFDGSATPSNDIGGACIVLVSPSGELLKLLEIMAGKKSTLDALTDKAVDEYTADILESNQEATKKHADLEGQIAAVKTMFTGALKELTDELSVLRRMVGIIGSD